MVNYAYEKKEKLSLTNYVRIGSPDTNYWVDFSYNKLHDFMGREEDFCLIIIGNVEKVGDFSAIPYSAVSHLFTSTTLYEEPKNVRLLR